MTDSGQAGHTERLWTPWRMSYVGGGTAEVGCIFCNRLERESDIDSLILHRAEHSFTIMNLYPYNTGHIMVVPNQHASEPAELAPEALAEIGTALPTLTSALRRAFACHGFNVGLNIGAIAGAGVEAHLHQHIVPRWQGDANFMPIIASTMTIPELIPVTYAKIRAELTREITGATTAHYVLLDDAGETVLLHRNTLPDVPIDEQKSVLQAVIASLPPGVSDVQLAGWAGPDHAADPSPDDIILTLVGSTEGTTSDGWEVVPITKLTDQHDTASIVHRAIAQRAPAR